MFGKNTRYAYDQLYRKARRNDATIGTDNWWTSSMIEDWYTLEGITKLHFAAGKTVMEVTSAAHAIAKPFGEIERSAMIAAIKRNPHLFARHWASDGMRDFMKRTNS